MSSSTTRRRSVQRKHQKFLTLFVLTLTKLLLLALLQQAADGFSIVPLTTARCKTTLLLAKERYEDDDDDDDEPPEIDLSNLKGAVERLEKSSTSFGLGKGRSSPSQRKAMGTSKSSATTVYVCQNCGSESLVWRGKCPTCGEWNTLQELQVPRSTGNAMASRTSTLLSSTRQSFSFHQSWLDGIPNTINQQQANKPTSIADIDLSLKKNNRVVIPDDDELNQVLSGGNNDENSSGGIVKGSLILLGGDPGVGKSTLALQVAISIANICTHRGIGMGQTDNTSIDVGPVWYVSGEETMEQIATRAQRLITNHASQRPKLPAQLYLLAETNLNVLSDQVLQAWVMAEQPQNDIYSDSNTQPHSVANAPPSLIVIDSIQTMVCEQGGMSSAGGMVQVRECMAFLLRLAKTTNIPILTIGHVTKEGSVAGPRMVEHMVDAVLYLEHDTSNNNNHFRWLRAQKNRFGSCQAVGLYDFQDGRLVPMPEGATAIQSSLPSTDMEGSALSICMEGQHRALTVEVQSLVTVASASFGKKTVEGIPFSRLNLLLGVLQKHCQLSIAGSGKGVSRDVYVNVVGSVSKSQQASTAPGLDLAVAIALASTYLRIPVRGDTVFVAQVGLLGELRPVLSLEARLLQAQRMGFSRIIVASGNMGDSMGKGRQKIDSGVRQSRKYDLDVVECATLSDALDLGLVARIPKRTKGMKSSKGEANSNITPNPTLSIEELYLNENIILDDEDDDDNDLGL